MKKDVDVLVIGGGVIGICSAHYLAAAGRRVTVVERGEIGSGCSYGNSGLIVPSHSVPLSAPGTVLKGLKWMFDPESPFYIKPRLDLDLLSWLWKFRGCCNRGHLDRAAPLIRDLSLESLRLYHELAALGDLQFGFEQRGVLALYNSREGLAEGVEEAHFLQGLGIEVEVLSAEQVRAKEPNVHIAAMGGVYYAQDAHLTPALFVTELARHSRSQGVDIRTQTEVLGFEMAGGKVRRVRTTKGDFAPAEVVLAGGSWSASIVRDLGLKLPIQPAKGYHATFRRPQNCPSIPFLLGEARVGVGLMLDAVRFAGTLELAGLDLSIDQRRVRAILRAVPEYVPDLDPARLELVEIWRGLRPCTPDGLPLLGRTKTPSNLTVAAGHATIGVSLGPVTGKLVSQVVSESETGFDLNALAVERFG